MLALAMFLQDASTGTGDSAHWMVTWMGVIALSLAAIALVLVVGGLVAAVAVTKLLKDVKEAVGEVRKDLRTSTDEIKGKLYPVIESVAHISHTTQGILADASPKLKTIGDHLVDTTRIVRESAEKLSSTVTDANQKTQRQVARVDGMVTAALNTTAEVVATIEHGIKVPARKIAEAATQAKGVAEHLLSRIKGLAGSLPFLQNPTPPARPRPFTGAAAPGRAPVQPASATPAAATGTVPLVK